jgi:hypothetical protein
VIEDVTRVVIDAVVDTYVLFAEAVELERDIFALDIAVELEKLVELAEEVTPDELTSLLADIDMDALEGLMEDADIKLDEGRVVVDLLTKV